MTSTQATTVLLIFTAFLGLSAHADQGYDNARGERIAQCLRNEIRSAPPLRPAELEQKLSNTLWYCDEVHYFWDANKDLAIFFHNEGHRFGATYGFRPKTDEHGESLVEHVLHPRERSMVSFANEFQHGTITMLEHGTAPLIDHYFVLDAQGRLIFERLTKVRAEALEQISTVWPAIEQHPMAVYGDTPSRPASWVYKSLGYGVCHTRQVPIEHPCF